MLAGSDGSAPSALPRGTPATLAVALARIAELMDENEDVLVLYTTSHGVPFGLYYNDGDSGYGAISPNRMAAMLDGLGMRNRLLILSACYSGVFVPRLQSETSAIVTAAAHDRSSFGCLAENDWTFFGDAMINHALAQAAAARRRLRRGQRADRRLGGAIPGAALVAAGQRRRRCRPLARRARTARCRSPTQPTGRPAVETSRSAFQRR